MSSKTSVPASKKVLIFGATGVIGKPITNALVAHKSSFDRLVVFTSSDTEEPKKSVLDRWKAQGVQVIVGDVTNDADILKAYEDIDTIVCALGRTAILPQIKLIQLADNTANIKRFIPSEFGTDIEHPGNPDSPREKPHQAKISVRAAIRKTVNLDYVFVVTGPYSDLYFQKSSVDAFGTWDVGARKAALVGTGDERISFTSMADVGKIVYTVLQNPRVCSKRALKVQSFVTTPNLILAEFERQTGSKWEVSHTSIEELKQLEAKMWSESHPVAAVSTLRRIWSTGGTLYDKWDNEEIGAPKMDTLQDAVRESIEKQTKAGNGR